MCDSPSKIWVILLSDRFCSFLDQRPSLSQAEVQRRWENALRCWPFRDRAKVVGHQVFCSSERVWVLWRLPCETVHLRTPKNSEGVSRCRDFVAKHSFELIIWPIPSNLAQWCQSKPRDETSVIVPETASNIASSGKDDVVYRVFHLTWLVERLLDLEVSTAMGSLEESGSRVSLLALRTA